VVTIPNSFKSFRLAVGMSTESIADFIGVSKSFVRKIETGDRNPSYNFLAKFTKAFPNSDIKKIFFNTNNHNT
jgi:putative transcriptional regulator